MKLNNRVEQLREVCRTTGMTPIQFFMDLIPSIIKYDARLTDYLKSGYADKSDDERQNFVTIRRILRFQERVNNPEYLHCFLNKHEFHSYFRDYIYRDIHYIREHSFDETIQWMLRQESFVAKVDDGAAGRGVTLYDSITESNVNEVYSELIENDQMLLEERIIQHPSLCKIYDKSVNTIRIITWLDEDNVRFLGARLRIGVGKHVDNLAQGGIAAPVDIDSGIVMGNAVDHNGVSYETHPVTGVRIAGMEVPFWGAVLDMAVKATKVIPEVRTVGWDIAICETGPELIEGNHNWCSLLWQLPVGMGLYKMIEKEFSR